MLKENKEISRVWDIYFIDTENIALSNTIETYLFKKERTSLEEKDLKALLREERKRLGEARIQYEKIQEIAFKTNFYLKKLENEEVLKLVFEKRILDAEEQKLIKSSLDIDKIYHSVMEESMEVDTYFKMQDEYKVYEETGIIEKQFAVPLKPDDVEFVYNEPLSQEEFVEIDKRLGILESFIFYGLSQRDINLWYMSKIVRMENIINQYYLGDGDEEIDEDDD